MKSTTISELTGDDGWAPLRRELDVRAFGINAWTAGEPGADLISEHTEEQSGHEELYLLLSGRATFTVDGETLDAGPGAVVLVQPGTKRSAVANEAGTTVVVIGGTPGAAFAPRAWETNAQVFSMFGDDRIEEAREILRGAVGVYVDGESIEYNLACCEARLGDVDKAFEHLRPGLAGRSDLVKLAQDDSDLDALRGDPRFDELVGTSTPG
jgi:mannose-6-phosphate isomerase-like protein (cupin superfamily)